MSKRAAAAAAHTARKKDNRFDPADFEDVLAPKGQATGAVTGADQPGSPEAPKTPSATESANRPIATTPQQRRRNSTSFDFPDYVNEGITIWLREHPEHNLRTMIHLALTKIGVHVEPEDLVPQRRRRR